MKVAIGLLIAGMILVAPAHAAMVQVEVTGSVEYNQLRAFPLDQANPGDPVKMTFLVDSDVFTDSDFFPTRGYAIVPESYSFTAGVANVGMVMPYPEGRTPYFVLRNNDPVADGFFVADDNVDFPFPGLPLEVFGFCGLIESHHDVSYGEFALDSLDILGALGTYDYDGLTRFYFNLVDCGFEAMGLLFEQMTISLVPVEVPVDVKPGSCPNPLNHAARGDLPVAILGTAELDVTTIDPASIRLNGVPALRSGYEDVGAPFEPFVGKMDCERDCHEYGMDGWTDLTVKFDVQAIVDALGGLSGAQCVVLTLTGNFYEELGGGPIVGEDVVRFQVRGPQPQAIPGLADRFSPVQPAPRPTLESQH